MDAEDWIIAALILIPGLGYMWINNLLDRPLAWLAFVGSGGGLLVVWVGGQSTDRGTRTTLGWIGGGLLLAGLIASVALN